MNRNGKQRRLTLPTGFVQEKEHTESENQTINKLNVWNTEQFYSACITEIFSAVQENLQREARKSTLAYIISQCFDSMGKAIWVCLQSASTVTFWCCPAIINVDILITCIFVAIRNHFISRGHVQILTENKAKITKHDSVLEIRYLWNDHKPSEGI